MPLTPLFPDDKTPVEIKQGRAGSCYLLASLDCIFNSTEGRKKIASMFREVHNPDGSLAAVEMKIERTANSRQLQIAALTSRGYRLREDKGPPPCDIITIPSDKLKEIDNPEQHGKIEGTKSNSLAVKIIEHISTFYYNAQHEARNETIILHDALDRLDIDSNQFVASLLNLPYKRDTAGHNHDALNRIIHLKTIYPTKPIYISMDWGDADRYGHRHGRHALRVEKIIPPQKPGEDYQFVLRNPWDNTKTQTFTFSDLKTRNCTVCTYQTDRLEDDLADRLIKSKTIDLETTKYIFANPLLLNKIKEINRDDNFHDKKISTLVAFHKDNPHEFERLSNCTIQEAWTEIYATLHRIENLHRNITDAQQYQNAIDELAAIRHNPRVLLARSSLAGNEGQLIYNAFAKKYMEFREQYAAAQRAVIEPAKPVVTPVPAKPVVHPVPVKPVVHPVPAKPVVTPVPAKPVVHPVPVKPVVTPVPAKPVVTPVPAKPVAPPVPAKPVAPPVPAKPVAPPVLRPKLPETPIRQIIQTPIKNEPRHQLAADVILGIEGLRFAADYFRHINRLERVAVLGRQLLQELNRKKEHDCNILAKHLTQKQIHHVRLEFNRVGNHLIQAAEHRGVELFALFYNRPINIDKPQLDRVFQSLMKLNPQFNRRSDFDPAREDLINTYLDIRELISPPSRITQSEIKRILVEMRGDRPDDPQSENRPQSRNTWR